MVGDFDFKQGDEQHGKQAKFAYGMKYELKQSNLDVPGPGTYNAVFPANQKKEISYYHSTDVRMKPESNSDFPGPGHYNPVELFKGPSIT